MNEYLLKAITRLFAIVAKEHVSDNEREKIKDFIYRQVNHEEAEEYLKIFDEFSKTEQERQDEGFPPREGSEMDRGTEEFVEDWANVILICKRINKELTQYLKVLLILRLVELIQADVELTERQENLLYYICKGINVDNEILKLIKKFVFGQDISELLHENILIADDGSAEDYSDCKHIERPNLTGFIAILYLPELETYFMKYMGISSIRLNGIAIRSRTIEAFPPGSNLRGDKVRPIYYSDVVSRFKVTEETSMISLIADDISLKFKQGRIGLRNIFINEESGKLVGIMGASGSGKSTLLEVLNGKIRPFKGKVTINGINIHTESEQLEGLIGYVPQDDLLMEDLTVFQNLFYAAELCLANYTEEEIMDIVNQTLHALGLYDIRDLVVGNPLKKTISGGQRKRLNIALELLREPSILFIDEPTSGLSSRDSEMLMDILKDLALKGKLVFVSIHQPSSDIFKMFDSLVILDVGGFQIYYGNPVDAVVYFRHIVNMVQRDQGACPVCGNVKIEQIFGIIETRVVNEYGQLTNKRKITPAEWSTYFQKQFNPKTQIKDFRLPKTTFKIPTRFNQFKVFSIRDLLSKWKNTQYMLINFIEAPLLALIIGYFVRYYNTIDHNQASYTFGNNPNIPTYFFMSIIVALFMGLTVSGEEIIKDRKVLAREKFLDLSRGSYLSSKMAIMFGISAFQMALFVIVANWLLQFKGMPFADWAMLFSTACFANIVGLNISSAFNSVITVYILIPIILIPQLLFNGVAIEFDKLNPKITDVDKVPLLGEMMTSKWAYEAIMVHQFKTNKFEKHFYTYDKRMANAQYKYAYFVPTLLSTLQECQPFLRKEVPASAIADQLLLLKNEISKELSTFGEDKFPDLGKLNPSEFDSAAYKNTENFLSTLKKVYINRYALAQQEKEDHVSALIKSEKDKQLYQKWQREYKNDKVSDIVRNIASPTRIVEANHRLVRKIDPIYADPGVPDNSLNFRTHYYAPVKFFADHYFETFWFNIGVIWMMTFIGMVALYFDWLKKLISIFDWLSDLKLQYYVRRNQLMLKKRLRT